MKIKISTNIDNNLNDEEIEITINASSNSDILDKVIKNIQSISDNIDTVVGSKENNFSIINVQDVICFYSNEQNNGVRIDI